MLVNELSSLIQKNENFLCIGLDSDISRLPSVLQDYERPVLAFNKAIIDATKDHCVSYKINTAFYESRGILGWNDLEDTLAYIPRDKFVIADAKRGDIGNTARQYAKTFFEHFNFDALTLNPYMGMDTVEPYLEYSNKTLIVLGFTSNKGAEDIERLQLRSGGYVFQSVMNSTALLVDENQLMFVVGATQKEEMADIRKRFPRHFMLVPGIGAQGGSADEVMNSLSNDRVGVLINSSRGIIFASSEENYAEKSCAKAKEMTNWMKKYF